MKKLGLLVMFVAVGASLSGCASSREAFFNDMWNGSGESGPTQGAGGGDTARPDDTYKGGGWPEEGADSRGWLPDR